jgi:drug/metabolite transporter (DMT)-like permease
MRTLSHGAFAALLAGAICIAFAPIFVRLSELAPTATAVHRIVLALPLLWIWSHMEHGSARKTKRPASRRAYLGLATAGLFFAGDLACWHWSIQYTTVANSTLLANFAPVFVTLASFALFGERFSKRFLLGLALAMAGACVLMGESLTISFNRLFGDALGIVTAFFYAGYIVSVGRLRASYTTATIMLASGIVTALALIIIAAVSGESLIPRTWSGWLVLVGLAWISHAGGQSLIAYALAHLPAALSSVTLLLQPAVAAVLAWIILAEPIGPWQAAGAAIIIAGIALARRARFTTSTENPRDGASYP